MLVGVLQILITSQMTMINVPKSIEMEIIHPTMQSQDLQQNNTQENSDQAGILLELEELVQQQVEIISIISLLALFIAGVIGSTLVSRHVSKPLNQLSDQIASINVNSLDTRLLTEETDDEVQQMAMEINRTLDRLERSFLSQEQFVLDAAHELRTPITTMLVQNDLLLNQQDEIDWAPKEVLTVQKNNLIRMEAIVEDLLVLANNEEKILKDKINLTELVGEVCIDLTWLSQKQIVEFVYDLTEAFFISANAGMIDRLVRNLIINAIQYNKEGGKVFVRLRGRDEKIHLEIEDTGIGIDQTDLPYIFDRFYRIDDSRSRLTGGTGLGLAIVKHIADTNHAEINVESKPGVGSCFTVMFPLNP